MAGLEIKIAGQVIELLPERAAFWAATKTLIVADLHWGKAETFQHFGLAVPSAVMEKDLARLENIARAFEAKRLLVLGDLIHARVGVSEGVRAGVADFFRRLDLPMVLVRGNHDRSLKEIPQGWRLEVVEEFLDEGPFRFRHDEGPGDGQFQWLGHLHPLYVARGAGDRVRLPCFWQTKDSMTLPAFSAFTAGVVVKPGVRDQVYLVAEEEVIEVPSQTLRKPG